MADAPRYPVRICPTPLGAKALAFHLMLVGTYFATPYMNLFFLLLVFLTVAGTLTTWWGVRNLAGLTAEIVDIPVAAADSRSPLAVRLHGGARRRCLLGVHLQLARREFTVATLSELCGELRVSGELPALPRGLHDVGAAFVDSYYPFGLLRVRRRVASPPCVVVYPKPADLGDAHSRGEVLAALCGPLGTTQGEPGPAGLREFRDGDEVRRVHWRATARRCELIVREFEGSAVAGIEICLDLRCEPDELERALAVLAALALWARDNKEVVLVQSQDHSGTYGESHRPWSELLRYLAAAAALPADHPRPPAVSPGALRLPAPTARLEATT